MSSNRYVRRCSGCGKLHLPRAFAPVSVFALVGMLLVAVAMSDQIAAATNDRRGRSAAQVAADTPILISGVRGTPADSSGNTTASVAVPTMVLRTQNGPQSASAATASTMTPRPPGAASTTRSASPSATMAVTGTVTVTSTAPVTTTTPLPTTTVTTTTTAPSGAQEGLVDLCALNVLRALLCP